MGVITTAYGVGLVVAPRYCLALIAKFSNYNAALYLTAFIVLCGILLLKYVKNNLMTRNQLASDL